MTFVSLEFLYFIAAVLWAGYLLPSRFRIAVLLLASLGFCLAWSPLCLYAILVSILVNFGLGRLLGRMDGQRSWMPLAAGVVLNVGALFFFRGYQFFAPELGALLNRMGFISGDILPRIMAPVGLSFYTMQAISWLVDLRRRQVPADVTLLEFAFYMVYFPKLIAGPIERSGAFIRQLRELPRDTDREVLESAVGLIILGLFRKVVIADTLRAAVPADIYVHPDRFSPTEIGFWILMIGPCIFNDFAGYTDMARGVSRLLGIELSVNFRSPNFNRGLSDFWTKWHITLSFWLRDYIFFPVSRWMLKRRSRVFNKTWYAAAVTLTMVASGAWHGFGINFIIWGFFIGILMIIEQTVSDRWPKSRFWQSFPLVTIRNYTFFFSMFLSMAFFLMDTSSGVNLLSRIFDWSDLRVPNLRLLILAAPGLWIEWRQFRTGNELYFMEGAKLKRAILLGLALLLVVLYSIGGISKPFVYQAF